MNPILYYVHKNILRHVLLEMRRWTGASIPKAYGVSQLANAAGVSGNAKSPNMNYKKSDAVYILEPRIAELISRYMTCCPDVSVSDTFFIEVNPGPGILTRTLLQKGICKLRLLERNPEFLPALRDVQEEFSEKVDLVEMDFFRLSKISYIDKITFSTKLDELFYGVPVSDWTQCPPFVIFAIVPQKHEVRFMRYLFASFAKLNGLYHYGRAQLVLFLSGKEYEYMMNEPQNNYSRYRMASVLYKIFFNIEYLFKEDINNFHPKPVKMKVKRLKFDPDHLYLVRLTPKSDLLSRFSSKGQLAELYYFVRQHMVQRKGFVIYTLEKWIPNCGPRLIKIGYTIFTRFGDLTAEQFLQLYLNFSSWPEYPDCQFHSLISKSEFLEEHIDDDDEKDVDI